MVVLHCGLIEHLEYIREDVVDHRPGEFERRRRVHAFHRRFCLAE